MYSGSVNIVNLMKVKKLVEFHVLALWNENRRTFLLHLIHIYFC